MQKTAKRDRAAYFREYRARRKGVGVKTAPVTYPDDPAGALAAWSREKLVVPPGHPLAGQPMELPEYGVAFLRDALASREALLSIGRKNSKSGVVAVYVLGRLVGPLRVDGWRAGVVSVNKEKAAELKLQCQQIAEASNLTGLSFRRSPAPGHILGPCGRLDILSADKSAGHAAGFDEAIDSTNSAC